MRANVFVIKEQDQRICYRRGGMLHVRVTRDWSLGEHACRNVWRLYAVHDGRDIMPGVWRLHQQCLVDAVRSTVGRECDFLSDPTSKQWLQFWRPHKHWLKRLTTKRCYAWLRCRVRLGGEWCQSSSFFFFFFLFFLFLSFSFLFFLPFFIFFIFFYLWPFLIKLVRLVRGKGGKLSYQSADWPLVRFGKT